MMIALIRAIALRDALDRVGDRKAVQGRFPAEHTGFAHMIVVRRHAPQPCGSGDRRKPRDTIIRQAIALLAKVDARRNLPLNIRITRHYYGRTAQHWHKPFNAIKP